MLKGTTSLLLIAIVALMALPVKSEAGEKRHLFFNNHPKIRKTLKAAGIGVATGGMAAPLLGHSVAGGAMLGASKSAAIHTYKERKAEKRNRE